MESYVRQANEKIGETIAYIDRQQAYFAKKSGGITREERSRYLIGTTAGLAFCLLLLPVMMSVNLHLDRGLQVAGLLAGFLTSAAYLGTYLLGYRLEERFYEELFAAGESLEAEKTRLRLCRENLEGYQEWIMGNGYDMALLGDEDVLDVVRAWTRKVDALENVKVKKLEEAKRAAFYASTVATGWCSLMVFWPLFAGKTVLGMDSGLLGFLLFVFTTAGTVALDLYIHRVRGISIRPYSIFCGPAGMVFGMAVFFVLAVIIALVIAIIKWIFGLVVGILKVIFTVVFWLFVGWIIICILGNM